MTDFRRDIDCSICPVKDGKTGVATIISDDGDLETSGILARLASESGARISIACPVTTVMANLRHWQILESRFPVEIVNHSWDHLKIDDDSRIGINVIRHQYLDSREFFKRRLKSPDFSFVVPNNSLTENGLKVLDEGGFLGVRSGCRGMNPLNPTHGKDYGQWLNLKCHGIGDPGYDVTEWLDKMESDPSWLIEMWHNVYTTTPANYQPIPVEEAERHLGLIREREGIWLAGFDEAISYFRQRDNVSILSFIHDGILHLKLERTNMRLPWDKFTSPLSVRVERHVLPDTFRSFEILEGIDDFLMDGKSGDLIMNIMPGKHGKLRILQ